MQRREFITLLGGAVGWPLVAHAQQPGVALVGLLSGFQLDDRLFGAVREGLKDAGYVEGRNLAIKYRSADGRFDRLPAMATDLVSDPVAVIVALAPLAVVGSCNGKHPDRSGARCRPCESRSCFQSEPSGRECHRRDLFINSLGAKRFELLHELISNAAVFGFLINPQNPTSKPQISDVQGAARSLGTELLVLNASNEREIDAAFTSAVQQRVKAVVVGADSVFLSRRDQIVGLATRYALPAIYYVREFAVAGGLISYGASITDAYRLAGRYAGRILNGEKPADLPIQQTVKFELAINLKTAKTLGVTVPPSLLSITDELIE
jgi:putative tryptophan/tyrosine transport system substrate-binding protein